MITAARRLVCPMLVLYLALAVIQCVAAAPACANQGGAGDTSVYVTFHPSESGGEGYGAEIGNVVEPVDISADSDDATSALPQTGDALLLAALPIGIVLSAGGIATFFLLARLGKARMGERGKGSMQ